MPSTIPYDPSLVLTSVVSEQTLKKFEDIAGAQAPVDAAQDALDSLISSRRGLVMTQTELKNLGIGTEALDEDLRKINESIDRSAASYAKEKAAAGSKIAQLRENMRIVHADVESPVDHLKTELKSMPLAAYTMNMDVEYFSYDSNSQSTATYSSQIAAYVSKSVGAVFGTKQSSSIGDAVSTQVSREVETHHIEGTLILSVTCTHKNAIVLAPFNIHVDKAIKVWNRLYPGKKLDPTSSAHMKKILMNESQEGKEKFSIVSGTTFGSWFVGMVHILNPTKPEVVESLNASAHSMQAQMNSGASFSNASHQTGAVKKFASDVNDLLSQQNVASCMTVLSTGIIPSTISDQTFGSVEGFTAVDLTEYMKQAAAMQNSTTADRSTVRSQAEAARTGSLTNDTQANEIGSSLSTLVRVDGEKKDVPDINAMMTALEDQLKAAETTTGGVPINHYLKDIDQKMLAEMWAAKYYPGQFMAIKYDDSEGAGPDPSEKATL